MGKRPIIKDGRVINVVALETGAVWSPPRDCELGPDGGEIGDVWNGSTYTKPPPPITEPGPPKKSVEQQIDDLNERVEALEKVNKV